MRRRTALVVSTLVIVIALILPVYAYVNSQGVQTVAQSILKTKFYPSSYNLLGSTTWVSGSLTNLQANDSSYMRFTSYVSATSATDKSDAFIVYKSTTLGGNSYPKYRTWTGSTASWGSESQLTDSGSPERTMRVACSPDPTRALDKMVATISNDGFIDVWYFDGSAWTVHAEHDADVDTNARRCADIAWESDGTDCLLVWGTASGTLNWRLLTPPNTLGAISTPTAAGTHPWVQLRTNPRSASGDISILGAMLDSANDIGALRWDGTTFTVIGTGTFSTTAGATTYECFDIRFNRNMPTEMKIEVEFQGSSDTKSWITLKWAIDSSFTTSGVTATFQLYNFNSGSYPTGAGSGYMTSTIGATDVTMEQMISTNPTYFKDASGNWKMKITGVIATKTCFNWLGDLVRLDCTH